MKIEAADREAIFNAFPVLASTLKDWQQETYRLEDLIFEPGEEVWLEDDDEAPTVLSESLAEKLNRETEAELLALKDTFSGNEPIPDIAGRLIVEMNARSFEDFTRKIGPAFAGLADAMRWWEFAVMSDCRRPILAQDND